MTTPLVRYLVVATTGYLPQKLKASSNQYLGSNNLDTVNTIIDVTSLQVLDRSYINKLKTQNKNIAPNSGSWAMRECNRKMRLRMKEDGYNLAGVTFYGVPVDPQQTLEHLECLDEFAMQMSVPDDGKVLAVSVMDIAPNVPMRWYSPLSANRNQPKPHATKYCEPNPGQVIKVMLSVSYSRMDDSWEHRDPVPIYYAVVKRGTASMVTQRIYGFDEETGSYDRMEEVKFKRKIKSNTMYWDVFYNEYHFQDYYNVDKIFDFPGI